MPVTELHRLMAYQLQHCACVWGSILSGKLASSPMEGRGSSEKLKRQYKELRRGASHYIMQAIDLSALFQLLALILIVIIHN